jgi:monofunctional biosynthetic peptidoglycan transglycosylase
MSKSKFVFFNTSAKAVLLPAFAAVLAYLLWLPYVPELADRNPKETALMALRQKQAMKKGRTFKPAMTWKRLDEISPNLVHAVLLAEDDTFYQHRGFDFEQIEIAVKINWKKKRFAYGGSTITQQLARTLYLSPSKNVLRKLKEALIAFWMERALPKKRILEIYLNAAEWGEDIFGAEAAARRYYGRSCSDLTPEESVALASILPSPRKWSPFKETPFMLKRRTGLLARMTRDGYARPLERSQKEEETNRMADELPDENSDNPSKF